MSLLYRPLLLINAVSLETHQEMNRWNTPCPLLCHLHPMFLPYPYATIPNYALYAYASPMFPVLLYSLLCPQCISMPMICPYLPPVSSMFPNPPHVTLPLYPSNAPMFRIPLCPYCECIIPLYSVCPLSSLSYALLCPNAPLFPLCPSYTHCALMSLMFLLPPSMSFISLSLCACYAILSPYKTPWAPCNLFYYPHAPPI